MANELQALLSKINEEGLKKSKADREALLAQAEKEKEEVLRNAKLEAEKIIADAKREADLLEENSQQALKQAARNVLLSLRSEVENRLQNVVKNLLLENLSADNLSSIILSLCNNFLESKGEKQELEFLLSASQLDELEALVKGSLKEDLQSNCQLSPVKSINAGFKLNFKGSDVFYDFTDEALAEAFAVYLSPKIAAILSENF